MNGIAVDRRVNMVSNGGIWRRRVTSSVLLAVCGSGMYSAEQIEEKFTVRPIP